MINRYIKNVNVSVLIHYGVYVAYDAADPFQAVSLFALHVFVGT